jgi:hypothetical protein
VKAPAIRLTVFLEDPPATVAFQEMLTPFDRKKGNKEEA